MMMMAMYIIWTGKVIISLNISSHVCEMEYLAVDLEKLSHFPGAGKVLFSDACACCSDDDFSDASPERYGNNLKSTLYRLEIFKIELFSVYGFQVLILLSCPIGSNQHMILFKLPIYDCYSICSFSPLFQCEINRDDFLDAEPDFLVNSTSAILERFAQKGIRCDVALKALCKKKGLHVEVKDNPNISLTPLFTWTKKNGYVKSWRSSVRSNKS